MMNATALPVIGYACLNRPISAACARLWRHTSTPTRRARAGSHPLTGEPMLRDPDAVTSAAGALLAALPFR